MDTTIQIDKIYTVRRKQIRSIIRSDNGKPHKQRRMKRFYRFNLNPEVVLDITL